jgi:hypothetical protein
LIILHAIAALAAPAVGAVEVDGGGHVGSHVRLGLQDCGEGPWDCPLLDYGDTAVMGGWVRASLNPRSHARVAVDLRLHHGVSAETVDEATEPHAVLGSSWRVQEAVIDLRELGFEALDLELGVQRVPWGSADGLHVVDRVNPLDLENPLALDARLPVPVARALLHRGSVQLEGVWVPVAWPAVLPRQGVELLPGAEEMVGDGSDFGDTFDGVSINEVEARLEAPARTLDNMGGGGRLSWAAPRGDLALSYFHGRDSLPQADGEMILTGFQTSDSKVDVAIPLRFPVVDVVGLEARGELFADIGGWVEAALVFPERTVARASQAQLEALERLGTIDELPDPIPAVVTQDGEPYATWILGLDRGFGRLYLNLQWLHGFPTERQRADIGDYASLAARLTVSDTVLLHLRALGDVRGGGVMGVADLELLHADAATVVIGGAWVQAVDGSTLAAFRGTSQVHGGVTLEF